jgi:hypothetical protein
MTAPKNTAARAIARLRAVRDEIEMAMRPPGERVVMTRQTAEAALDDLGVVARIIRDLAP